MDAFFFACCLGNLENIKGWPLDRRSEWEPIQHHLCSNTFLQVFKKVINLETVWKVGMCGDVWSLAAIFRQLGEYDLPHILSVPNQHHDVSTSFHLTFAVAARLKTFPTWNMDRTIPLLGRDSW